MRIAQVRHAVAMNWNSAVPDLLVGFAIALFGLFLATRLGLRTLRKEQRDKNIQLIHNLADDLAARRAFTLGHPRRRRAGKDAARCLTSVQLALERVSHIRDQIKPDDSLRQTLRTMGQACVTYKNAYEIDPRGYIYALMDLRRELVDSLRVMERHLGLEPHELPDPGTAQSTNFMADSGASSLDVGRL